MSNKDKLKEYRESGQTFCPYLFLHYHSDTDKATKLCCHTTRSVNGRQIPFDGSIYNSLRKKMMDGERLNYCTRCYEAEDNGFTSLRQRCIDDIVTANRSDLLMSQVEKYDAGEKIMPLWYDLRISNNCNLTCIMCGPQYSSAWAKEKGEEDSHLLYEPDIEINKDTFKIQLAGGEPFMIKKFARMLSEIENTDCDIVVNTNATIVTKPLFDQLKRFKNVWIVVSIDGFRELNEKIRRGSTWSLVEKHIDLFIESGFHVLVNTVLQKDNVNTLSDLGRFLESKGIDDWIISPMFTPAELQWHNNENVNFDDVETTLNMHAVQRNENSKTLLEHVLKEKNKS